MGDRVSVENMTVDDNCWSKWILFGDVSCIVQIHIFFMSVIILVNLIASYHYQLTVDQRGRNFRNINELKI